MGLYQDIDQAIKQAFDTDLFDAVKTVELVLVTQNYDPANDTPNEAITKVSTRAVVGTVDNSMVDGEVVQLHDTEFTILQSELAATPKLADAIEVDGISFSLNTIIADPADVTWTIIGRFV